MSLSLDPVTAKRLSGMTVDELLADGRLFVVDYTSKASLIRTNLSAAACDVYFFLHPNSSNFLPLAIVTLAQISLIRHWTLQMIGYWRKSCSMSMTFGLLRGIILPVVTLLLKS